MKIKPFQTAFERAVENPQYDTVAISGPRGLGKTFLLARILTRCLTPGDSLHEPGKEYILGSATLKQARQITGYIREWLGDDPAYRWVDSANRLSCTHLPTNTHLTAISSNAKSSFGIVNVPLVCLDEPGALEIVGGQMLADSLFTAQGKPGSRLKLVLAGTLGPLAVESGHWWFDLINTGSDALTHVQHFAGDIDGWDSWKTIQRANPLVNVDAHTRQVLLAERDAARKDTRLKARFLTYRLNVPTPDETTVLLTLPEWRKVVAREAPPREGRPVVSADIGHSRAWTAATAMWANGRVEAFALAPGIPDLDAQERRDHVPKGVYSRLAEQGSLMVAEGLNVPEVSQLVETIREKWGRPKVILSDRFHYKSLEDAVRGYGRLEPRVARYSESTADIRALRRMALDGPMSVAEDSKALIGASMARTMVKNDDGGSTMLLKRGSNNEGRDDVVAALVLGCGYLERQPKRRGGIYLGSTND